MNNLLAQKALTINSSQAIVADVQARQQRRLADGYTDPVKPPAAVPQFDPPVQASLQPISLLHLIGRATTPPVPNLADLSATWALYRYIWAFSHASNRLNLSAIAKNIDFHQKSVLSDEVGVGMAFWVMSTFFGADQPVDVDVALRNPQVVASMGIPTVEAVAGASPDYIYPLPNGRYAIVECKGSQSGKSRSKKQLRRGLEQVPSIRFVDGQRADEYVIATRLSRREVEVYVIDPPGDGNEKGSDKRSLEVRDKDSFDREITNLVTASKLAYAGADALARDLSRIESEAEFTEQERREPPATAELPELDVEARGREATFPSRSDITDSLTVFMGIEATVYESLTEPGAADDTRGPAPPIRFREAIPEGSRIGTLSSEDGRTAISIDDDGTVFSVRVS